MNSATKKQHWNYSTKYNADFPIKKLPGKKKNYDHIRSPIAILRSKSFDSFPAIGDAEAFVNKYKLLMDTVLGSGRASTVYLGERLADGLKVAIKFVEKSKIPCNGWAFIHGNRVPFEYCALRQLAQCDGVNKILDAYEAFGDYLFVLELTEDSSTLGEFLLSRGPFDEPEARYFFRNLVQIVEKCRQMGIYHRDLKEMNILVDIKRNLPILIDFGSSALVEHSPYSYLESCGTPAYTTPELLMEPWRANDGMESAVYSLGAIFDNMVNGFRLFDCIPTKYITEECRHLIAKMLDPCPRKRPSSFKAILADPWMGM
jgi:serine/threonine protein kinase